MDHHEFIESGAIGNPLRATAEKGEKALELYAEHTARGILELMKVPVEVHNRCTKAKSFGYDGVEIACWGDHFEVDKALSDDAYIRSRQDILDKHGLKVFAISTHLVGQCVCDALIDERHKGILPSRIWSLDQCQ